MEFVLSNDEFQFKDNKAEIVKEIKNYIIKISNIKSDNLDYAINIDCNYIFNRWINTFGKGYKTNKLFTRLVQIHRYQNLKIDDFRKALLTLIPGKKFEIISEDPSKFDMMINNKIYLNESEYYQNY